MRNSEVMSHLLSSNLNSVSTHGIFVLFENSHFAPGSVKILIDV